MSNDIHLVVQSRDGKLSDLIQDFKKFTANQILAALRNEPESRREWILERYAKATQTHTRNKNFQVGQYGNHAEETLSNKFLWDKLNYIHLNPPAAQSLLTLSKFYRLNLHKTISLIKAQPRCQA